MVYYGSDLTGKSLAIPTLRKALSSIPDDFPVRGPKIPEDGDFKYENSWRGDIEKFSGEEFIVKNRKKIYTAKYAGGLVDWEKE